MIPERTLDGIKRYVEDRIPPGGFLTAVLENNLKESFARADDENLVTIFELVSYIYNRIPFICWGSPEKVKKWLKREK